MLAGTVVHIEAAFAVRNSKQVRCLMMLCSWGTSQVRAGEASMSERSAWNSGKKRHPVAKVKGGWSNEEDALLVGCVQNRF